MIRHIRCGCFYVVGNVSLWVWLRGFYLQEGASLRLYVGVFVESLGYGCMY